MIQTFNFKLFFFFVDLTVVISLKNEYLNLIIMFLTIVFLFILIFYVLSKIFYSTPYINKITSYECGFEPFGDSRSPFNVQFYIIALLFLLFDIELVFMFPWALSLRFISYAGNLSMFIFLLSFVFGMIFEWKVGALSCLSDKPNTLKKNETDPFLYGWPNNEYFTRALSEFNKIYGVSAWVEVLKKK